MLQQLAMQDAHISFLQTLHNVRVGNPQTTFVAFLSSSISQDIDEQPFPSGYRGVFRLPITPEELVALGLGPCAENPAEWLRQT